MKTNLTGVLLVGGASRRMGRAKATLKHGLVTQATFLAAMLEQVLGNKPLLLGNGESGTQGLSRVSDREAGAGPLSALLGLFDDRPNRHYLVLACDLFAMNAPALDWLCQRVANRDRAVIWPLLPRRSCGEPLASIYRPSALPFLEASWRQGERSLIKALPKQSRLEPAVPKQLVPAFQGANTPAELFSLMKGISLSKVH